MARRIAVHHDLVLFDKAHVRAPLYNNKAYHANTRETALSAYTVSTSQDQLKGDLSEWYITDLM
jgi:hypothetical protein